MSGIMLALSGANGAAAGGGGGEVATDTFTGADLSALSANWTVTAGLFKVSGNAISPGQGGGISNAFWNANTFNDRQYSELTMTQYDGGVLLGPGVRMSAGNNGVNCIADNTQMYVNTYASGTETTILGPVTPPTVGQKLRLEADGTTLRIYFNATLAHTLTSVSMPSSGAAGIGGYENGLNTRGDPWAGGNL